MCVCYIVTTSCACHHAVNTHARAQTSLSSEHLSEHPSILPCATAQKISASSGTTTSRPCACCQHGASTCRPSTAVQVAGPAHMHTPAPAASRKSAQRLPALSVGSSVMCWLVTISSRSSPSVSPVEYRILAWRAPTSTSCGWDSVGWLVGWLTGWLVRVWRNVHGCC